MGIATACLEDVKASLASSVRTHGLEKAVTIFSKNQTLLYIWALNFLAVLTLTGAGQCTQVNANLQCPVQRELKALFQIDPITVTAVAIIMEKSARLLDVSDVNYIIVILPYLKMHLKYVKMMIIGNSCSLDRFPNDFQALLPHVTYGGHLNTTNNSQFIFFFMTGVSSHLQRVTAMTLRAIFPTSVLPQNCSENLENF